MGVWMYKGSAPMVYVEVYFYYVYFNYLLFLYTEIHWTMFSHTYDSSTMWIICGYFDNINSSFMMFSFSKLIPNYKNAITYITIVRLNCTSKQATDTIRIVNILLIN